MDPVNLKSLRRSDFWFWVLCVSLVDINFQMLRFSNVTLVYVTDSQCLAPLGLMVWVGIVSILSLGVRSYGIWGYVWSLQVAPLLSLTVLIWQVLTGSTSYALYSLLLTDLHSKKQLFFSPFKDVEVSRVPWLEAELRLIESSETRQRFDWNSEGWIARIM